MPEAMLEGRVEMPALALPKGAAAGAADLAKCKAALVEAGETAAELRTAKSLLIARDAALDLAQRKAVEREELLKGAVKAGDIVEVTVAGEDKLGFHVTEPHGSAAASAS